MATGDDGTAGVSFLALLMTMRMKPYCEVWSALALYRNLVYDFFWLSSIIGVYILNTFHKQSMDFSVFAYYRLLGLGQESADSV